MDNTLSSSHLIDSHYPRWLYGVSVLWGILLGPLFYASARFPQWYFYNLGPSSEERGPFWDAGVFVIIITTGLISAVYFWLIMKRVRNRSALRWVYPLASILIPVLVLTPLVIWWYYVERPSADALSAIILWLLYGVPALICMIPFGLLSGIVFHVISKPRAQMQEE